MNHVLIPPSHASANSPVRDGHVEARRAPVRKSPTEAVKDKNRKHPGSQCTLQNRSKCGGRWALFSQHFACRRAALERCWSHPPDVPPPMRNGRTASSSQMNQRPRCYLLTVVLSPRCAAALRVSRPARRYYHGTDVSDTHPTISKAYRAQICDYAHRTDLPCAASSCYEALDSTCGSDCDSMPVAAVGSADEGSSTHSRLSPSITLFGFFLTATPADSDRHHCCTTQMNAYRPAPLEMWAQLYVGSLAFTPGAVVMNFYPRMLFPCSADGVTSTVGYSKYIWSCRRQLS
ncbi:hypothetical protein FA95DRAFT_55233 [Auriscalpium vulgare]|uniref:Uncharacterized protein n=1 Tax=Auriscalpium vulgare TaxID=40419 RepID=A0ACB8S8A2_9AGAM|nr:hypothetical protein FA95DRAFT_55233 [Auriscalpium vulgare]